MSSNGSDTILPLDEDSCSIPKFALWNYHQPMMSDTDVEAVQMQYGKYCDVERETRTHPRLS